MSDIAQIKSYVKYASIVVVCFYAKNGQITDFESALWLQKVLGIAKHDQ